eukprot:TRINITY_DN23052_c0_g1_i1.p1 TRINITY_DN23052_c0_g1~~TRINITY_DN23052_c0_g1_i1.p1  ORF type:complete len:333 (+),score=33.80 TRINITY_DN23052_c0_g1_i1:41-1039(+)
MKRPLSRFVKPTGQRRWAAQSWYVPKPLAIEKHVKTHPWEHSIELPSRFGSINNEGMEHFWVSRVMDRLPQGSDPPMPDRNRPLAHRAWQEFYIEIKGQHPMPVTQWFEEDGWLFTKRKDPYLKEYRNLTVNVYQTYTMNKMHAQETISDALLSSRKDVLEARNVLRMKYSPVPVSDNILDWIKENIDPGQTVVEVQAKLGYWAAQLRQWGIPVVAYEEWHRPYTKKGQKQFTEVIEDSGEKQFSKGDHDNDAVLTVFSDRPLSELDNWKGDTLFHIGCGAIGGLCDVGGYLISRNEGWYLHSHHRVLIYPLYYEHAYCFKKLKNADEDNAS